MLTRQYQGGIITGVLSALLLLAGCQSQLHRAGEEGENPPYHVFISHAGEDKDTIADPLYKELRARNPHIRTFLDRPEIPYGQNAPAHMINAMDTAPCGVHVECLSSAQRSPPRNGPCKS